VSEGVNKATTWAGGKLCVMELGARFVG